MCVVTTFNILEEICGVLSGSVATAWGGRRFSSAAQLYCDTSDRALRYVTEQLRFQLSGLKRKGLGRPTRVVSVRKKSRRPKTDIDSLTTRIGEHRVHKYARVHARAKRGFSSRPKKGF
jgi:hypothetical protein